MTPPLSRADRGAVGVPAVARRGPEHHRRVAPGRVVAPGELLQAGGRPGARRGGDEPAHPALAGGRPDDRRLRVAGGVEQAPVVRDRLGLERGDAAADRRQAGVPELDERRRRGVARVPLLAVERVDERVGGRAGRRSARRRRPRRCARTTGARRPSPRPRAASALSGSPILPSAWQARAHSSSSAIVERGDQLGHGFERAQLAEHDDDQPPPARVARIAEQRAQLADRVRAGVEQHLGQRRPG